MRKFAEIIESTTVAPPTNCLWIKGNDALYFTNGKWVSLFKKEDFINITDRFNKHSISLIEAIQIVPTHQRIDGLVITFEDINGDWRIYQFRGDAVDFFDENKWTDLYDYTNYIVKSITPDEEDLTVSKPDKNGNAIVSLKDRVYNESNFSGKGYKILRKNIQTIDGVRKNILTQDMINKPNTIYEIRYDFDLNGAEITIPENCFLEFVGGSISNGVLNLNNCGTNGTKENFHNISIIGACNLNKHGYKIASVIGMIPNSKENAINNGEILKKLIELRLSLFLDGTYYISMGNSIYDLDYEFCLEGGKLIIEENGMKLRLLENASFLLKNTNIESTSYCAIIQNPKTSWKIDRVEIHNTMLKNVRIILHFEDIDPEKNSIGIRKFIIKNSTIKCSPFAFSIKDALFENEMQICNNYFYDIDQIGFIASTTNSSLYSLTKGEMSVPMYIKNNIFRGINSEYDEHYAVQVETKEVHFLNNTVLNMASTKETCTVSDSYINANILYFIGNICTNILGKSGNNSILCFTKNIFNKDKYSLKFISNNLWTVDEKYLNEIGLLNKSNIIFNFVSKIDTVIFTNNKILYPNREYGISFKPSEIEVENFQFTNNTIDNVKYFPKVISNTKVIITDNFFNSGDNSEYEQVKVVSTTGCDVIFDNTLSKNIGVNLQGPKIIAKVNMSNMNYAYNVPTSPCELINSDINVRTSKLTYYLANLLNTKFNVKSLNSPITLNFFLIEDSAGKYYRLKFNNVIADIKLMDDSFQLMLNRKSLTQVLYSKYTTLLNTSTVLYIYKKTVSGKNFIIIQLTESNYANFSVNFCDIPESAFTLDCNPSTGTNNERPVLTATNIGFQYYDTTLKKYIVWNGTEWTNIDGTTLQI